MGSLQTLIPSFTKLVVFLLLLLDIVILQADPEPGFHGDERDALYALKAAFNNSLLNKNWNGIQCYLNNPKTWFGIRCLNGRVTEISLEGIGLNGSVNVNVLANLTELVRLSFKNNWISGNVMNFSSNTKLKHIDLSENMFNGPISRLLLGLDNLESLQLQCNNLTGPIPEFSQGNLREFNVSHNNLSGEIPSTYVLQSFNYSSYFGNPGLCGHPLPTTCYEKEKEKKKKKKPLTGASLVAIFIVLDLIAMSFIILFCILCYKKVKKFKKERKGMKFDVEKKMERRTTGGKREGGKLTVLRHEGGSFELTDLLKASAEGLGKGNFGNAYKVTMDSGLDAVVKRVKDVKPLSMEEFNKRVRVIADLKHPNLLPLLAYCYSKDETLLVYKFALKGSLFNRIHGGRGINRIPFTWNSRLLIAQGVARAIDFMHLNTNSHTSTILHGNLKSSNVLLNENEEALVSDYGLTSLISLHVASQWMASYKSPECQSRRKISNKSDVWSYGCLLLELLTGRIPTSSAPQGVKGADLCSWVQRAIREEWTGEIFDVEISMQRNANEGMLKLLQIALHCCDQSPEMRPDMREVVREVEAIKIINVSDDDIDNSSFDPSLSEDSFASSAKGSGIIGEEGDTRR